VHAQDEEELAIAPPERVTLKTDDGVDQDAMWYAGGVATTKDKGLENIDG